MYISCCQKKKFRIQSALSFHNQKQTMHRFELGQSLKYSDFITA